MNSFLAQIDIGQQFTLKGNKGIGSIQAFTSLRAFISTILPNVFIVAGIILIFFIIGSGIGIITSAGNPEAQQKSKGTLTAAVVGFLLIFASWWIIQIIQVLTAVPIL